MSDLKAYEVTEPMNGHGVIVFATNGATARRKGSAELDTAFEEVKSCRRAPQFDQYAPGPVPALVLIDNGWWFECQECGRRVTSELSEEVEDQGLNPADFQPIDHDGYVFCSSACQDKHKTDKLKKAQARAELERIFLDKFPGATVASVHVPGTELELSEPSSRYRCSVDFTFPGSKHGHCKWVYGEEVCLVPNRDLGAFQDWRNG